MLPYTAADMLNKMRNDYGLNLEPQRSRSLVSGRSASRRYAGIRRAITSMLGAIPFL